MTSLAEQLHKIVDGLMYFSETETPVTFFELRVKEEAEISSFIAAQEKAEEKFINNTPPEQFFERFENCLAFKGPDELMNENARRFLKLRDFLKGHYSKTLIYKIEKPGDAIIPIFIVGKSLGGDFVALRTVAIET